MPRRAYRAAQLGAQLLSTKQNGYLYRVVVADTPPAFHDFVDGIGPAEYPLVVAAGDRFAFVVSGDAQAVSWTSKPDDAVVRLPDADVGPQPPGATLVPFRDMAEGPATLWVRTGARTFAVSIQTGLMTCLPDDFPRYPLAMTTSVLFAGPCRVDMATTDSPSLVFAFYTSRLAEGDWQVVSTGDFTVTFSRRSNPAIGGTMEAGNAVLHILLNGELPTPSS
jgi:hypothetical protein